MDNWTPMLFGLSGVAAHIKRFKTTRGITNDYGSYLCFVVISALWASMGYVGNFGFIVGMFELLTGLFCVVGLLMDQDGSPFLDIELKASTEDVNVQL
ncbi:MAG: uncharacterized protein KVP18_001538 [Porospora cf. gigantea A]|nr:MAG: hypothetical protein KVP18_001538 [Porospora cf. gigantea A]